jgi:hypothetical protein
MVKLNIVNKELPRQKRGRHTQKDPERARRDKKVILKFAKTEDNVPARPVNAKGKAFDLRRLVKMPK